MTKFAAERERFDQYMSEPELVYDALRQGAAKARPVAQATIARVRESLGF